MAWGNGKPFFGDGKSGTSLYEALKGLWVILLPAVYFILRGRTGGILDFMLVSNEPDERREEEAQ